MKRQPSMTQGTIPATTRLAQACPERKNYHMERGRNHMKFT